MSRDSSIALLYPSLSESRVRDRGRECVIELKTPISAGVRWALERIYIITSWVLQPPPDASHSCGLVTVTHDYATESRRPLRKATRAVRAAGGQASIRTAI